MLSGSFGDIIGREASGVARVAFTFCQVSFGELLLYPEFEADRSADIGSRMSEWQQTAGEPRGRNTSRGVLCHLSRTMPSG